MKTLFRLLALAVLCSATTAFGQGAAVIIKQRAKEAAGRPVAAPAPAGQPAAGGAPAPAVAAGPNLTKILSDIAVIKSRSQATQEQKDKLATNLGGVALGATKPATDAVQSLANALADAIAGKKISSADQTALAQSLAAALNAAAGSPQLAAAVQGVKDALTLAGANDANIQAVAKALMGLPTKAK